LSAIFAAKTRDREVPVWHDPTTGVIFIDDFYVGDSEYESGEYRRVSFSESFEDLADTERRASAFKPLYAGRSVLDFGCGAGTFLHAAKPLASQVQGVELKESFRRNLIKTGFRVS